MRVLRHVDLASRITIVVTFILFAVAVFLKGLKHDLLLEAGIFLVSAKLIIMSYRQHESAESIQQSLDELKETLRRKGTNAPSS